MTRFHLAQVNIGRFVAPVDDPRMEGSLAAGSDQGVGGQKSRVRLAAADRRRQRDGDPALCGKGSSYGDQHVRLDIVRGAATIRVSVGRFGQLHDRKRWFEPIPGPILALWWLPAGHIPSVAEALDRLGHLKAHRPTQCRSRSARRFRRLTRRRQTYGLDARFCEWAT